MSSVRFILLLGLLCGISISPASAQINMPDVVNDTPLSETELLTVFKGQTHRGSYNFKRRDIDTFAFEETTYENGDIRHIQGERKDTGDWSVIDNQICYRYDADNLLPACFEIYQRGNCYYHFQKTVNGLTYEKFTARSVIKGDNPDCAPHVS